MDQKTWNWKKRSTEKTLVADKSNNSSSRYEENTDVEELLTQKAELERDLEILNDKLYSALSECNAKDNVAKKQVKIAEEAIAGWEKTETEAIYLKQELDKVLHQKAASEERLGHLDAALKECMKQLRFVREEQEKRVHFENTDLNTLMLRLESTEKANTSLKYEVRVLEKELDIRNEEREFNRRTADVAQKQHQESFKKIAKLENECQRLRLLVHKGFSSPHALAKIKNGVEISNPSPIKGQTNGEQGKYLCFLQEQSLAASSDLGSDDKASCAGSWASALLSELEHFKNEKQLVTTSHKNMGNFEMELMDDFAEMEKLAVVSVDYRPGSSSHHSSEECNAINNTSNTKNSARELDFNASLSIQKILELLEGINIQSQDNGCSEIPTGYTVRSFQWKSGELCAILQQFVKICKDLLNGTANLEKFAREVASNLEWIMNHCFSLQDVSSMKEEIRNHLDWDDESRSESSLNGSCRIEALEPSKDIIENLRSEMGSMEKSKGETGNQIEKRKMIKEDLETQHMETNLELGKACEKIPDSENELENKNSSREKTEETCNDPKIQPKSMAGKEVSDNGKHRDKQLQNDWEITAASKKLAECQETILNLGKQLKALSSPNDSALFDKVIISTPQRNFNRRSSLLDKMIAEDQVRVSPKRNKQDIQRVNSKTTVAGNRDIVPCKKNGGRGFFKRLFWRRRKGKHASDGKVQ